MQNRVEYLCDGLRQVFPVPFEYGSGEQVAVNVIDARGVEKRLEQGRDYLLAGGGVLCARPAGERLIIWLEGGDGAAAPVAANAALAYGGEARAYDGDDLASAASREIGRIRDAASQEKEEAQSAISAALKAALGEIAARCEAETQKTIAANAALKSELPHQALFALERSCEAGAFLDLPLNYVCGTATLALYADGVLLIPGRDYTETGLVNSPSSRVLLLIAMPEGREIFCRALPVSYSRAAAAAAEAARESQSQAAAMLTKARAAEDSATSLNARSGKDADTAQAWAQCSQKSADKSHEAACSAWQAAAQVSIHARRPGICAVKCECDIAACSPGLFIINPHITHAPTPFMGIWPAQALEDMAWDGVFFLGACQYPDDPELPPQMPDKPQPEITASGDTWLPCGHQHTSPACHLCAMNSQCAAYKGGE